MWNWENNMLILVILTQKSQFCDNDAIYDVIMQEPVRKWRHNHRHNISRDSFAEKSPFKTFSINFIFRQIDRAIFAVRGPSSLGPRLTPWEGNGKLAMMGWWNFGTFQLQFHSDNQIQFFINC